MSFSINIAYSAWWVLLIVAVAAGLSYILYYAKLRNENLSNFQRIALLFLRFLALFIIGILLLKPFFKRNKADIQKPLIVFAVDNSTSMVLGKDSLYLKDSLSHNINELKAKFASSANFKTLSFGDSITDNPAEFKDVETNFERLFNEFNSTYFNQNIGALVIVSDGICNAGIAPKYSAQNLSFPVYTIPVGDTVPNSDLLIAKIEHNQVVYKGSNFPVNVGLSANMLTGENISVGIYRDDSLISNEILKISSPEFYKNIGFNILADTVGIFEYAVKIEYDGNETNKRNNSKTFVVEIEEDKRKILLIQNGYHPDVSVINTIVEQNPAFEIEIVNGNTAVDNFKDYSLIILHQLPSLTNSMQKKLSAIIENELPILFILGSQSSVSAINNLNFGCKIDQSNDLFDDVRPFFNQDFNLFNTTKSTQLTMEMPSLYVPFGKYEYLPVSQVLLYQQIGQIQTSYPLWAFADNGGAKKAFIMGEGLWKWRLNEYRKFHDHNFTNELIMKTIQYLAIKDKRDAFTVDYLRKYNENQAIEINAKLLNASNEMVQNAQIQLNIIDENGNVYPHSFKAGNNGYVAELGLLNAGKYQFSASTKFGNKDFVKNGTFIVKENRIEQSDLLANYNLLYNLANNTGGKVISVSNFNDIFTEINKNSNVKSIKYQKQIIEDILNQKILLIVIILLVVIEWFLRKYWGLV